MEQMLCLQSKVKKGRVGKKKSGDRVIARDRLI
jgi:hypothetical protein